MSQRCSHGKYFPEPCDLCEEVGLVESLDWMQRVVKTDMERLKELRAKKKESKKLKQISRRVKWIQ